MLRKYTPDSAHVVDWGQAEVDAVGPSRRDQYVFWIAVTGFVTQDREAFESAMSALWSGGANVGARGHDAGHLSLLV